MEPKKKPLFRSQAERRVSALCMLEMSGDVIPVAQISHLRGLAKELVSRGLARRYVVLEITERGKAVINKRFPPQKAGR